MNRFLDLKWWRLFISNLFFFVLFVLFIAVVGIGALLFLAYLVSVFKFWTILIMFCVMIGIGMADKEYKDKYGHLK